jgi:hypothetical protein
MEQVLESPTESARGASAASWPAIVAGAFVAASVSLVLLALGSGLGFAAISPWSGHGVTATTFAITTAIWLIVMQWVSSAFGGYITGRLRTRWVGTHTHEVFFRDTAHGLVMWAVATVLVAATLATSLSSAIGGGVHAVSSAASVPDADRSYLAETLATRTGLSPTDAQKRVGGRPKDGRESRYLYGSIHAGGRVHRVRVGGSGRAIARRASVKQPSYVPLG